MPPIANNFVSSAVVYAVDWTVASAKVKLPYKVVPKELSLPFN